MEEKGFMLGVVLGAAAFAAYEMGNKAKKTVRNGKQAVKSRIEKFMD